MRSRRLVLAFVIAVLCTLGLVLARHAVMTEAHNEAMKEACCLGDTATIRGLLRQGASVNAPVWENWTALMYAADNARPDAVRVLIGAGADVNAETGKGFTALSLSRGHQSTQAYEVTALLIGAGARS